MNTVMEELKRKIAAKVAKAKQLEEEGANKFLQITARMTDPDTGRLDGDVVIQAIIFIKTVEDAASFYEGFVEDIKSNPKKYPDPKRYPQVKDAARYAQSDIRVALGMHFTNPETHKLWGEAIPGLW